MKLISFVVPSYNASKYLNKVIPSLLVGGDDVEIIIVNDGSKDNTLEIARDYERKNSNVIVIDKENGGHGSTINEAIKVATGLYFKCVDADDWLDKDALLSLLDKIKSDIKNNKSPDLYLTNFVYENVAKNEQDVWSLKKYFKVGEIVTWQDIKPFNVKDFLMMHMFVYKLDILKQSKLSLPLHTFYVDNLYVYKPLYYVNSICYLDLDLYRYYVGRSDQSVSFEQVDLKYDHQIRVFKEASLYYKKEDLLKLDKHHRKEMIRAYFTILWLTQYYCLLGKKKGKYKEYKVVLRDFKKQNPSFYSLIHRNFGYFMYSLLFPYIKKLLVNIGYHFVLKKTAWN